uniref:Uncharacterized protein n=1 Tax=Micrurus paraensis TaxID=1970185 RepID=A0A2D4KG75_9SAUR
MTSSLPEDCHLQTSQGSNGGQDPNHFLLTQWLPTVLALWTGGRGEERFYESGRHALLQLHLRQRLALACTRGTPFVQMPAARTQMGVACRLGSPVLKRPSSRPAMAQRLGTSAIGG